MAYINRNTLFSPDIKLSTRDYYDFQLSNYSDVCGCNEIINPLLCINFVHTDENCADDTWVDAISEPQTIVNFGITGYDSRYVNSLTSSLELDGELNFCVKKVDGDLFCYDIQSGTSVELCGGFFQGFYKLDGISHQTLPDFFQNGWTAEFNLMKQSGCTCETDKPLLNEVYPNNDGIFYFYGTRAENKFCSFKEHLLGYEVQSGITFLESLIKDMSHITPPEGVNPFLFFNCPSLNEYFATATGTTFEIPDCCDGLKYNALAFRITPDGNIGYRYLGTSGSCVEGKFEEFNQVYEKYSEEEIIQDNQNYLVTIKFENHDHLTCKPKELTYGVLSIYVNGFLKLRDRNFPNIIPYKFDDLSNKQLGVPFNISIGGGTQGLIEMQTGTTTEYNVCDYSFYIKKDQKFKGIILNGETIFTTTDYTYLQSDEILQFLETNITNKFGKISIKETTNYVEFTIKLMYDVLNNVLYSVEIDSDDISHCCNMNLPDYSQAAPKVTNCFTFVTDNNICGILEENFAGTFIGTIHSFCLYDTPLSLSNIRCNYENLYL